MRNGYSKYLRAGLFDEQINNQKNKMTTIRGYKTSKQKKIHQQKLINKACFMQSP